MGLHSAGLPYAELLDVVIILIVYDFFFIAVGTVQKFHGNPVVNFGRIFAAVSNTCASTLRDKVIRSEVITDSLVRLPAAYLTVCPGNDFETVVGPEEIGVGNVGNLIHNLPGGLCIGAVTRSGDKEVSLLAVPSVVINSVNLHSSQPYFVKHVEDIVSWIDVHAVSGVQ